MPALERGHRVAARRLRLRRPEALRRQVGQRGAQMSSLELRLGEHAVAEVSHSFGVRRRGETFHGASFRVEQHPAGRPRFRRGSLFGGCGCLGRRARAPRGLPSAKQCAHEGIRHPVLRARPDGGATCLAVHVTGASRTSKSRPARTAATQRNAVPHVDADVAPTVAHGLIRPRTSDSASFDTPKSASARPMAQAGKAAPSRPRAAPPSRWRHTSCTGTDAPSSDGTPAAHRPSLARAPVDCVVRARAWPAVPQRVCSRSRKTWQPLRRPQPARRRGLR